MDSQLEYCPSCFYSDKKLEFARVCVGILGNMVSVLLYCAPILTFRRVIKKRSTEEFSCVPYVLTLLNSLVYVLYASPLVSHNWDNILLFNINGFGLILELSFISIFFYYSSSKGKKTVALIMTPVVMFVTGMFMSTIAMHDRDLRKAMIGSFGFVSSIGMYGAPLVAVKRVIQTKSVEYMPFYLSFFSFLASIFWMLYGLLSKDILLASPCFVGCPLGILQLALYCMYRNETPQEAYKAADVENGNASDLVAPLINETSGVKN